MKYAFLMLLSSVFAMTAEAASFRCAANGVPFSGYMTAFINVSGELDQTAYRSYIRNYHISYDLMIDDLRFAELDISQTDRPLRNSRHYSPTVYRDHLRFDFSHYIKIGKGRLMMHKSAFTDEVTEFQATMMLTGIEDHAGGSVRLNCFKGL